MMKFSVNTEQLREEKEELREEKEEIREEKLDLQVDTVKHGATA
tara:strand:+ start:1378 stop:1509 length:132 start_codon:yes stop_codon:yes gene_type:complete